MPTLSDIIKNKKTQAPSKTLGSSNVGGVGTTSTPTYNKADYQSGWGIGYGAGNVSNNFNQWNNIGALQNEQNRMNTVLANRDKFGMPVTTEHQAYMDRLNGALQPLNDSKTNITNAQNKYNDRLGQQQQQWQDILGRQNTANQQYRDAYTNGQPYQDYQAIQNATIQDIGNKYGIDFSKDYATRQAEAEAQALRDANANAQRMNESQNKQNLQRIENNLMSANEALDRNYFLQGLGQGQDQVESGINAGIAADQNLRLAMARQASMGDAYRDAGLGRMTEDQRFTNEGMRLTEGLGTINQQSLANAERMYRDNLTQGYGMLSNDRNFYADQDQRAWERMQTELQNANNAGANELQALQWMMNFDRQGLQDTIGNEQWNQDYFRNIMGDSAENDRWLQQFNYGKSRDSIEDAWRQGQFDYTKQRDQIGDQQWQTQFDWGKVMDEAGLTGLYNNNPTWQRVQDQFGMDMAGKEFGLKEAEFAWRQQQAALDRAMANAARSRSTGGGGGSAKAAPAKANTGYNAAYDKFNQEMATKMNNQAGTIKNIVTSHPMQKQADFMRQVQLDRLGPVQQPMQFVVGPSQRDKKKK